MPYVWSLVCQHSVPTPYHPEHIVLFGPPAEEGEGGGSEDPGADEPVPAEP